MAKRLGTFKKILAETLLLSSHKVTKWSWRGRTSFFFTLACFARQCGAGLIINEAAAALLHTRESRERRVNRKGQRRRKTTFTLMIRDVVFLLLFPSPLHPLLSTNKIHFSGFLTTPCEAYRRKDYIRRLRVKIAIHAIAGELTIAWQSQLRAKMAIHGSASERNRIKRKTCEWK